MQQKPRVGAIAYDERGQLGVVQKDVSTPSVPSWWAGITLPGGERWTSISPKVVAYLDEIAPPIEILDSNPVRCSVCDGLFTWDEALAVRACPRCSSTAAPEAPGFDFVVRMNWEEARLLALFAHSWATQAKLPSVSHVRLERAFRKFRRVRPEGAFALLEHEAQEEAVLEESLKTFAARLTAAGGRAN